MPQRTLMCLSTGQIAASVEMLQHRAANQEEVKATCSAVLCNAADLLNH